jgi:hypothetical protein
MNTEIPILDRKDLRKFGLVTGAIIVGLFALFFPWLLDTAMPVWPWILAGLLWAPALLIPQALQPVYRTWMKIGHAIGWVNSRIVLGLIFYLLVLPMGMIMRLFGRDPMARKLDDSMHSYRVMSVRAPREQLERPF